MTVIFVIFAYALLGIRSSAFGRRLTALAESPSASSSLGISQVQTKLLVFAVAAGIAGVGGALYGGVQASVTDSDFALRAE